MMINNEWILSIEIIAEHIAEYKGYPLMVDNIKKKQ